MNIDVRYCEWCGARLGRSRPKITHYDTMTGKPFYEVQYVCPNKRWWHLKHDKYSEWGIK